ncbi:protein kinase [Pseudenhygromyxa sp. WMMC2535]|uniref:serine/threonine-protein kinase n=1 Tax=Pseudenhygromyxa sp. WMMC2535 TaxID=2712867 RepID=UPI001551F6DF|nr:serine/threonine-protein kinase [Pseudenhygromyxa sp. WMMC2535]NVB41991.1 protein kinase [Pseudenhygromyxa sp. WMMC2535]
MVSSLLGASMTGLVQTRPPRQLDRQLGKYELIRLLGRGGMGEVFLARLPGELGFEKRLVLKTIRSELADDPHFVELFAAEAKTAVALSHPNIAPIYELGRAEDGSLYTAMGWVDGPSVAVLVDAMLRAGDFLGLGAALYITREILDGLAYAHSREHGRAPLVHRDITPRNVLLDRSGRVQIVDFGIAKAVDAEVRGAAGSVGYMAPEQARGGAVDPRADVFSVGCVLYELLTNRRAFPSEGVWMRPTLDARPGLPADLRAAIERALALSPEDRFPDAGAFLRALAPILAEHAPAFGTLDLAAMLRERFPDGWDEPGLGGDGQDTPATKQTLQTFATRLLPGAEEDAPLPGSAQSGSAQSNSSEPDSPQSGSAQSNSESGSAQSGSAQSGSHDGSDEAGQPSRAASSKTSLSGPAPRAFSEPPEGRGSTQPDLEVATGSFPAVGTLPSAEAPIDAVLDAAGPLEDSAPTPAARRSAPGGKTKAPLVIVAILVAGLIALAFALRSGDRPTKVDPAAPERSTAQATDPERSTAPFAEEDAPLDEPEPTAAPAAIDLSIEPTPEDAALSLDGRPIEGPPYVVQLRPDAPALRLELRHADYRDETFSLDLDALDPGQRSLALTLDPLEDGRLTVLAPGVAWAEVWVDGEQLGATPLSDLAVREGKHKLEVRCLADVCGEARRLYSQTVLIKAGRTRKVVVE